MHTQSVPITYYGIFCFRLLIQQWSIRADIHKHVINVCTFYVLCVLLKTPLAVAACEMAVAKGGQVLSLYSSSGCNGTQAVLQQQL